MLDIESLRVLPTKWLLLLLSLCLLALMGSVVTPSMAAVEVQIRGNVYKIVPGPKLQPIANQQITIVCGSVTKTATTGASGLYTIAIAEPGCGPYSQVTAKSNYNASLITRQVQASGEGRATADLVF